MLKISDYISIMLSFLALLAFYLIFAGNISVNLGTQNMLETIEFPENYLPEEEYRTDTPVFAVICGKQEESDRTKKVVQMISNSKKEYALFSTVEQISEQQAEKITTLLVTADSWEEIGDKSLLFQYAEEQGKNIVFTSIMKDTTGEFNKVIGIRKNKGFTKIEGVMIFEEMFIQGMVYYDNLKLEVSDVTVDARCEKLMIEKSEKKTEQRDLIPLIWKKRYEKGCFYVVNGDFLEKEVGMGIFTGILSRMEEDFLYPVVNAKANLLSSFPELNNPYNDKIKEMYHRDTNMYIRDIVWPSMVKLGESNNLVFSAKLNQPIGEGEQAGYEYIVEQFRRRNYEMEDSFEDRELDIPYICQGHKRKSEEILKMQSSISGMGFATHYLDMSEVMGKNADDQQYEWSAYSLELSKLMYDLYQNTEWMDAMTVFQAVERYKRYLLIRPVIEKEERQITVKTENFHDVCFYMIRTKKNVLPGDGYEVTKVGDDAYLIEVKKENITIWLEEKTEEAQRGV